jgi:GNAT superfamily N-acetyltransferase
MISEEARISGSPGAVDIAIVAFGTPLYEHTKMFREAMLRQPLGLRWSAQDLIGEESQIHIAALALSGAVVGTVLLKPLSEDAVKLRQMAVSREMQGIGLGKKLVLFAESAAKDRGFQRIELHARISAQAFYQKLGYRIEGAAFTEVTVPTILMKKALAWSL